MIVSICTHCRALAVPRRRTYGYTYLRLTRQISYLTCSAGASPRPTVGAQLNDPLSPHYKEAAGGSGGFGYQQYFLIAALIMATHSSTMG